MVLGIQKSYRSIDCWVHFCFIMGSMSRNGVYFGTMAMVLLSLCGPARGQDSSGSNDCITALVPCANYLNVTKPPSSCCSPLVTEYKTNKACLCKLLNNTELITQFHINITQAFELPIKCGLNASASGCSKLGENSTSSGSASAPKASTSSASTSSASSKKIAVSLQTISEILPLLVLLLLGLAAQVYE